MKIIESKKARILFIFIAIVTLVVMSISLLNRNEIGVFASYDWISVVQPLVNGVSGIIIFVYLIMQLRNNNRRD